MQIRNIYAGFLETFVDSGPATEARRVRRENLGRMPYGVNPKGSEECR
jgi:hypothetical protein